MNGRGAFPSTLQVLQVHFDWSRLQIVAGRPEIIRELSRKTNCAPEPVDRFGVFKLSYHYHCHCLDNQWDRQETTIM